MVSHDTSQPPVQADVQKSVKFTCPRGKWCTAGLIVNCTEGSYNPLEGQDLGTACIKCPEFSTSHEGATSVSECRCQDGFIQTILADGTGRCECAAGFEIMNGVRCGMHVTASNPTQTLLNDGPLPRLNRHMLASHSDRSLPDRHLQARPRQQQVH